MGFSFTKDNKKERNKESKTLKKKASKKPATLNPSTNLSAKSIIPALITNKKSPRVMMVAGSVSKTIMGLTKIFKSPITKATVIAEM